jgi:hypothetical protein
MSQVSWTRIHGGALRTFIATFLVIVGLMRFASGALAGNPVVPTATNDEYSVVHDQILGTDAAGGVLANDTLPPGWTISLVSSPSNGLLDFNTDGSFQYEPFESFVGDDAFVYQMLFVAASQVQPAGVNPQATVTIHVTNSPPVPGNDNYATDQDTTLTVPAPGVLVNDSDPEGDPIEITGLADDVDNGTLTFDTASGGFEYIPDPGFVGIDTFVYTIIDVLPVPQKTSAGVTTQGVAGVPATVTITVTGVDTPTPEPTSTTAPGEPTSTPAPPAPTATSGTTGGVTDLPDTGAGSGSASGYGMSLIGLIALTLFLSGLALRTRLKSPRS